MPEPEPILPPEGSSSVSTPEGGSVKPETTPPSSVEVETLRDAFFASSDALDEARLILRTAQTLQSGHGTEHDSSAHELIAERRKRGESIDDIISKSAANVRGLRESSLGNELLFRKAEASLLESQVGSSLTKGEAHAILEETDDPSNVLKLDSLTPTEIRRRGEIRRARGEARGTLHARARTLKTLRTAEVMERYPGSPVDVDTFDAINRRIQNGETLDTIIAKARANLEAYDEIEAKRQQLAKAEERIKEIEGILDGSGRGGQMPAAEQRL